MTVTNLHRRKSDKPENLWELLGVLVQKPKNLVITGAVILAIIAFSTIQFSYQDGKFTWQKVPISRVISAVAGIKHKSEIPEK